MQMCFSVNVIVGYKFFVLNGCGCVGNNYMSGLHCIETFANQI